MKIVIAEKISASAAEQLREPGWVVLASDQVEEPNWRLNWNLRTH